MAIIRPTPESYYYSGQGRLGIGDRDPTTGAFNNVLFIGNVTSLTVDIAVTKFEHKESMSGDRSKDKILNQERTATFRFVADSLKLELLSVGLYGTASELTNGTVTGEMHKAYLGKAIPLRYMNASNIVITKGGSAVAATDNWDYDDKFGTIYVKANATGLSDEDVVSIAYSYGAQSRLEAFTRTAPPERYLRFEGLNTVDGSFRLLEIPRASFDPLTGLEFINEEFGSGEFSGEALVDLTVTGNGISKYFRETRLAA